MCGGRGENFKLSEGLVLKLRSLGIFTLNQVCSLSLQRETLWKNSEDIGLEEGQKKELEEYVSLLKSSFIHSEEEKADKLGWTKNPVNGDFMAKLGYKNCAWEQHLGEKMDWWKQLWKFEGPLKDKLTLWLNLNNKLLTWDNLQKRGWIGPNRCALCHSDEENVSHLFNFCSYAESMWKAT